MTTCDPKFAAFQIFSEIILVEHVEKYFEKKILGYKLQKAGHEVLCGKRL